MAAAISAQDRLAEALARIADPAGEGARVCLTVYESEARSAARAADARRQAGTARGPLDGAIVTIKDLFDVAGEVTRAGSKVLSDENPAAIADAPVVRRLREAGAVIVAKTNMTEFAFSGIGLNPHFGNPGNPADRSRVPGGSSSGAAVAVADRMCEIAIGTDTGGSTRIPAALCGVVGFKPSKRRVPTNGAFPLSFTLDSVGPLAASVAACAAADAVMAAEDAVPPSRLDNVRIGVVQGLPLADLDATVGTKFAAALSRLGQSGIGLRDVALPLLDEVAALGSTGAIIPPEAFALHRDRLKRRGHDVDPNVRARIERASGVAAADYIQVMQERARLAGRMDTLFSDFDILAMPTTAIVAPKVADVAAPESFVAANIRVLRNTALVNFLDLCAISLPMPGNGLPAGLMLVARNGEDRRLFAAALAVEAALAA